jgi:hypothetical protein
MRREMEVMGELANIKNAVRWGGGGFTVETEQVNIGHDWCLRIALANGEQETSVYQISVLSACSC